MPSDTMYLSEMIGRSIFSNTLLGVVKDNADISVGVLKGASVAGGGLVPLAVAFLKNSRLAPCLSLVL